MIHVEHDAGITLVRLDHGKAHALDLEMVRALQETVNALERQSDTRAVVLTGTGSIFCAGVDLFRLIDGGEQYIDAFLPTLIEAFLGLFRFSRPLVAAVNGHAIAGGCVLAAASDYRIMARGPATIGVPELRVGVPFPLVAIEILRFATSEAHLQELVYRGATYRPDEAYALGLVDETAEPEALLDRAVEVARHVSSEPTARFRITKRQLRRPALERMERFAAETDADVLAAWKEPTTVTAIREYVEQIRRKER